MGITLLDFVRESNRIEGIHREPHPSEVQVHERFLALAEITTADLGQFVGVVAGVPLRDCYGRDVRVGAHFPPPGGPEIREELDKLLAEINAGLYESPWAAHVRYEKLHPFMDGNGRSGRVLWAWQMRHEGHDPFALPFLHRFYYQTLDASGSASKGGGSDA
jgi:hypothetical protein